MVQILEQQISETLTNREKPAIAQIASSESLSPSNGSQLSGGVLMTFVSWLFLIGSLIFQLDALLELTESWSQGLNLHVLFHLSASLLFTVGSLLFVIQDQQ